MTSQPDDYSSMTALDVRRLRWQLGLTQTDLADELGLSKRTIIRWENDQAKILRVHERALRDLATRGPEQPLRGRIYWTSPKYRRLKQSRASR